MLVPRMVDRILARAAGGGALQARELSDEPVRPRQHHAARIEQRQEIYVKLALDLRADLVADAALLELLTPEFAAVAVAHDLRAVVGLQQHRALSNHLLSQKRRAGLPDAIDHDAVAVAVRDSNRERIPRAARRVNVSVIDRGRRRRHLVVGTNAGLDHLERDETLDVGAEL